MKKINETQSEAIDKAAENSYHNLLKMYLNKSILIQAQEKELDEMNKRIKQHEDKVILLSENRFMTVRHKDTGNIVHIKIMKPEK